ncbi:hypothetical protein TSAR_014278 [Trichomalopsis sarcophagae]|uniref:Major facilitator superfamily (MFS) profile domain-containing protein n=1 Tax=Trichomalopsis sarcophagae TaxID=543379 RepID=A0A232FLA2_9HYME|nr:hypothetical protein TSAR_014278 [Trichomalopsis sarcophagae]
MNCTKERCDELGRFKCKNKNYCLANYFFCNGRYDCGDKSDEMYCSEKRCIESGKFGCKNTKKCTPKRWVCDGSPECPDLSDEADCSVGRCKEVGKFKCRNGTRCIDEDRVCNGSTDCNDGSDEADCTEKRCNQLGKFKCKNKNYCSSRKFVCDGYDDCGDSSDEVDCSTEHCEKVSKFKCKSTDKCVTSFFICNGQDDCGDNSDEVGCEGQLPEMTTSPFVRTTSRREYGSSIVPEDSATKYPYAKPSTSEVLLNALNFTVAPKDYYENTVVPEDSAKKYPDEEHSTFNVSSNLSNQSSTLCLLLLFGVVLSAIFIAYGQMPEFAKNAYCVFGTPHVIIVKLGPSRLNGTKEAAKSQEMEPAGMPRPKGQRTQWKQWAACISATLSMVAAGTVYGWSTTIQTRLTDNTTLDVPIHVTGEQSSWIISLVVIGSMMGAFYGAYVAASCGRKICLLMSSLFYILGWLLVIFAHNVWYLYISRLILGIGVGMSYTANPMYVSEVADVNIRGALSTLIAVNVFTGSLISCSVGPWTTYLTLGIALLCIPILFVLTFAWFPESPYYLLSKGKSAEAASAIAFFQGITDPDELRQEVELVRRNIGKDSSDEFEELKFSFSDFLLLMKTRNRRALVIVMGLILGQQLSGSFTTMQYLEMMFHDAKIGIDSHTATIIVLVVAMVSGGVSTMTVEGAGRRLLLLYSSFACALSLGVLGVYLLIKSTGADLSSINLLPVFDIIVFQAVYQIGLGTMPNLLIGELFPTNVKGIAGAVIIVFDGLMGFIVSKYYEPIFIRLGGQVVYLFFCVSTLGIFFFIYAYVPETKRKTFLEIQDILDELRPFKAHSSTSISCLPLKRSGGEEDNKTEEA